jgi:hypothetical protein
MLIFVKIDRGTMGTKCVENNGNNENNKIYKTKINLGIGVLDVLPYFLDTIVDNCMEYNMTGCFLRIVKITHVIQEVIYVEITVAKESEC